MSQPFGISLKNSLIVACLWLLLIARFVWEVSVVDVVWGVLASSSPDEACSNRNSRPDPVRIRLACIASDVSLPLVNVLEVSV